MKASRCRDRHLTIFDPHQAGNTRTLERVDEERGERRASCGGITGYKGKRLKVLVVDDKVENRYVLRDLLTPLGFEIIEAENGPPEVEANDTRTEKGNDLILTDLVMPDMDGFKAVKEIRLFDTEVPIIAISASVWDAEQQMSRKYGCNAKPVEAQKLLALIEKHLGLEWLYEQKATEPKRRCEPPLIPPTRGARVLYELAMLGQIKRIREQADHLEQLDKKYVPFANKWRQLAREFAPKGHDKDEKILALVN